MAAVATSLFNTDTPVADSLEIFNIAMGSGTTLVITPTNIKAITHFELGAINAAAGSDTPYMTYVYGAATLTLNAANNTNYLVTVHGTVA